MRRTWQSKWPLGVLLAVVVLAVLGLAFRGRLSAWAFDVTGEEAPFAQVRALAQLPLNLTHPPLRQAPQAAIAHSDVNPFGINTFLHHEVEPKKREQQAELIAAAGFHWIRQEFPWEDIEIHGRGDFTDRRNDAQGVDAWAKYDDIVDLAEAYDLEIIARLSNPPAWSRAAGNDQGAHAPPDDYDDYARFAGTVAARYRGRIRYYQVWNEPNIYPEWGELAVSPEDYTDLLCRAYRAIKEADPQAVVLSAALAPTLELNTRNFNDFLFLQRMYDAGAADCFDVLSMQGYGLWSGPTDERMRAVTVNYGRNEFIRDIMVRNGDEDKAIWISEMNWNVAPEDVEARYGRVTSEQQARYATLAYQRAEEDWPWVGVVAFWYFKRADSEWLDERRPEAYFQMADPDFTLMPTYDAMQTYTSQPPVMYAGNHSADHWAVAYSAGWEVSDDGARAPDSDAGPLTFTFSGSSLEIVYAVEGDGGATLQVDDSPVRELDAGAGSAIWRGSRGEHHVEIVPEGTIELQRFVVRDDRPLIWPVLGAGLVLLVGGWLAARRLRFADSAEGRDDIA